MMIIGQLKRNHINTNNYKVINRNNNKFINSDDEEADEDVQRRRIEFEDIQRNRRSQSLVSENYYSTDEREEEQIVDYQYISCTAQNIGNKIKK